MKLFRINKKRLNVPIIDIDQRYENEEKPVPDEFNTRQQDTTEIRSIGSELDEKDQFEIVVRIKDRSSTEKSLKKKRNNFLFGRSNNQAVVGDDSTVSSITTDGKRRFRLLKSSLYEVAASTQGPAWCCIGACCDDDTARAKQPSITTTALSSDPSTGIQKTKSREDGNSNNKSMLQKRSVDPAANTLIVQRKSWTGTSTMLSQPSFQPHVPEHMKEKFISSIQRRKELLEQFEQKKLEEVRRDTDAGGFKFNNILCFSNSTNEVPLIQEEELAAVTSFNTKKGGDQPSAGSSSRFLARMRPASPAMSNNALFDTLSEDDGDDANADHDPRSLTDNEQMDLVEALRNGGLSVSGKNKKRSKFFLNNGLKKGKSMSPFRSKRRGDILKSNIGRTTVVIDKNISSMTASTRDDSSNAPANHRLNYIEQVKVTPPPTATRTASEVVL